MSLRVPFNDDEWIHFQPIACHLLPNGMLHRAPFREWCGSADLMVAGMRLPLRAYGYIGVSQAVYFLPFWEAIRTPLALRLCTGSLWFLNSWLLARLIMAPWALVMCVAMSSAPLFSQHLIDTGPFAFQFTMVLLALRTAVAALTNRRRLQSIVLGALAAVPAFLAFEQKATAVFALPAACFLLLAALLRRRPGLPETSTAMLERMGGAVAAFVAVVAQLLWWYVNLRTIDGNLYRWLLFANNSSYGWTLRTEWYEHALELYQTFAVYPSSFFHRVFGLTYLEPPLFVPCLAAIFAVVVVLLTRHRLWRDVGLVALSAILTLISLAVVSKSARSWAGHHVVYSMMIPFLALSVSLSALLPRVRWHVVSVVGVLLMVQLPVYVAVATSTPLDHSSAGKQEILALVDEPTFAASHVVVHLSWGAFYQDSLFGPPSQVVIWSNEPDSAGIDQLATETRRRVAYVHLHGGTGVADSFQQRGWKLSATSSSGGWELWEAPR